MRITAVGEVARGEVARAILETSRLSGEFRLRSGQISDTYFDKYQFESEPELLDAIAALMVPLLPDGVEVHAGLEMGGIPVATAISLKTGTPAAFLRKKPKTHGTCKYAEGPELTGRNIVLIEDVVSSGGQLVETLRMLRADGVHPSVALCVIDREMGGAEALASEGIELRHVFTMGEIEASGAA